MEMRGSVMNFNGKILKKIREQKNVNQVELCKAIQFSQSLLSKYERCLIKAPPAHRIKQIADYLGVPYESFFVELEKNEPVLINQTSGIPERIDVHVHVKIDWGLG